MKGTERNQPCPCGSGVKAKKCDHQEPSYMERMGIKAVVVEPHEGVLEIDAPRPRRLSPMMLAAIASMMEVPPRRMP